MGIKPTLDWTHTGVAITDIRKIKNFYMISIDEKKITSPLMVDEKIFNERLRLYFLKDAHRVSREDILSVKWNLHISKGYYIKIYAEDDIKSIQKDPEKHYVSYLEIMGPLATFQSVYRSEYH